MVLEDFISENREKVLALNLIDYPSINIVLQKHKDKLRDAEFETEIKQVKEIAEKAIKFLKEEIQRYLRNNHGKAIITGGTPNHLWAVRLLIEYRELLNRANQIQTPQPLIDQQVNIFCKSMPLSIPKEHFERFTTSKSKLNERPFLNEMQFQAFIDRAFLGKNNIEKIKFNMAPTKEKLKVQYVFRDFFNTYGFEYGFLQDDAIKLLTDNFIGWKFSNVKNNFKYKPRLTI